MKFGDRTICAKAFSGSIGNAEALAIKSMYTSMADESCSITPGGLVRDGDASISSAKHEICNELGLVDYADHACVVHINRNVPNHLWSLYTKKPGWSQYFRTHKAYPAAYPTSNTQTWNTTKKYQIYKKHFIDAVRRRVATEFVLAQADSKHQEAVAWLVHACKCVARCIVRCFTGDHSKCEQWSRVCTAHTTVDYMPRHLPNGQVASMTSNDKVLFFHALLKSKLGEKVVRAQRDNLTTNTVESRWKSSDKSNMKGITSSRNHVAKAASGYLKHSTGVGLDVIRIAQTTGAGLPPSIISRAIRKRTQHAQGGSERCKKLRRASRKRKNVLRQPILVEPLTDKGVVYKGKTVDFR